MFDPRPPEPTPLGNRSLTERSPWKCDRCGKVHESLDEPGIKMCHAGMIQRVCWAHIEEMGGMHDGE